MQRPAPARGLPQLLGLVEHRLRAARPRAALGPVRAVLRQPGRSQPAALPGQVQLHPQRRVPCGQLLELGGEDDVAVARGRVHQHHVGHGVAPVQGAQHRHDRGDAAARGEEEQALRRRVGQHELTLGERETHDRAGPDAVDQVAGQEALRHRLDGDRDVPAVAARLGGQGVGAPVEATLDLDTDADVLTGTVVERPAQTGPDDQRGGVGGLGHDLHHPTAQLPHRPQRVQQQQVVIGQQGRGETGGRFPCAAQPFRQYGVGHGPTSSSGSGTIGPDLGDGGKLGRRPPRHQRRRHRSPTCGNVTSILPKTMSRSTP